MQLGSTDDTLHTTTEQFEALCVLSMLVWSNQRSIDAITAVGIEILNRKKTKGCCTLKKAWNMYKTLLSRAIANKPTTPLMFIKNGKTLLDTSAVTMLNECQKLSESTDGTPAYNDSLLIRDIDKRKDKEGTSVCNGWMESVAKSPRPIRVFVDGVFDLVHSGHLNALRQAALMGDKLIVGIASDEEVRMAKGAYPIYSAEERAKIIKACKWVTDVIVNTPYTITLDFLETTGCDFVTHGDDMVYGADGKDCYEEIRKASRMKTFHRTEGISSTSLVSRLLDAYALLVSSVVRYQRLHAAPQREVLLTSKTATDTSLRDVTLLNPQCYTEVSKTSTHQFDLNTVDLRQIASKDNTLEPREPMRSWNSIPLGGLSSSYHHTPVSSKRLASFMKPSKCRLPCDTTVYVDDAFDILHPNHVALLDQARKLGSYLIVGVFEDQVVRQIKGPFYPVQGLLERSLCISAMSCVDEVIVGVPLSISDTMLKKHRINIVLRSRFLSQIDPSNYDDLIKQSKMCFATSNSVGDSQIILQRVSKNYASLKASVVERQVKEKHLYESFLETYDARPCET